MAVVNKTIGTATHVAQTGTLTAMSAGTTAIVGSGTNFDPEFTTADRLIVDHGANGFHSYDITAVTDDTNLTIAGGLVFATSGGETPYKQGTDRDYETHTLWEADDGGGDGLGNDDCTGSAYNDSVFDESWEINFSANSTVETVAAGERHDGTAGTGARVVRTVNVNPLISLSSSQGVAQWLELDMNGNWGSVIITLTGASALAFRRLLVHGTLRDALGPTGGVSIAIKNAGVVDANNSIVDCIIYDFAADVAADTANNVGIRIATGSGETTVVANCTIHDVTMNNSTGDCFGIQFADNAQKTVQNCVITDTGGDASGTVQDYSDASPANAIVDHNLASDTSASGTGSLDSKTSANQFVSTSPVNLHLKAGADAIDAGTDLGTTPSGVEIDIDGWNRDSDTPSRDPWDMGAHEFLAVLVTLYTGTVSLGIFKSPIFKSLIYRDLS